ncbi:MAG: hypothetical protein DI626_08765 [Micavibrio aeruginosavorus]|uniref:Uncharacterized protein n=1 Tax=Micavibrio aeruginosavorus TaxID=349221 RepID=A0A2W5BQU1_9BACT|nr:MAG: hypothetical protein DI626_08765 [Micavibrio aeruginosavorus]
MKKPRRMNLLVLTENAEHFDLCKAAFTQAGHHLSAVKPEKTITAPINDADAVVTAYENVRTAMRAFHDQDAYISIQSGRLKTNTLTRIYAVAIGYREPGLPVNAMSVHITPEQDGEKEITSALKRLLLMPHDVPTIDELANQPSYF